MKSVVLSLDTQRSLTSLEKHSYPSIRQKGALNVSCIDRYPLSSEIVVSLENQSWQLGSMQVNAVHIQFVADMTYDL